MNVDGHDKFRADVRCRLAKSNGQPDPVKVAQEIHAEVIERCGQRRSKRAASRVLDILDELNREDRTR
jgi:hypothetical protein